MYMRSTDHAVICALVHWFLVGGSVQHILHSGKNILCACLPVVIHIISAIIDNSVLTSDACFPLVASRISAMNGMCASALFVVSVHFFLYFVSVRTWRSIGHRT